jgi:hypothetical protein
MTDRRAQKRYDVVGSLWGVLELTEEARVVNISGGGVLLDSPFPCAVDSTQAVQLGIDGQGVTVDARVRYVHPEPGTGREPPRYYIGAEFISPPLSVQQSIELMSGSARSHPDGEVSS